MAERAVLARLAVFAGGWTLAVAEVVCAGEDIDASAMPDLLDSLVNRSLVQFDATQDGARYGLLATVRHYAWEQLVAAPASTGGPERGTLVPASAASHPESDRLHEQSLALGRELGFTWVIASSLGHLGNVACSRGDYRRAGALHRESLTLFRVVGDKQRIAEALGAMARLAMALGQPERGARLYGAAAALRRAIASPLPPNERAEYDRALEALHTALGEEAFAVAWAEGEAMALEQAIACALAGQPPAG